MPYYRQPVTSLKSMAKAGGTKEKTFSGRPLKKKTPDRWSARISASGPRKEGSN
jgi:hypothetical protein